MMKQMVANKPKFYSIRVATISIIVFALLICAVTGQAKDANDEEYGYNNDIYDNKIDPQQRQQQADDDNYPQQQQQQLMPICKRKMLDQQQPPNPELMDQQIKCIVDSLPPEAKMMIEQIQQAVENDLCNMTIADLQIDYDAMTDFLNGKSGGDNCSSVLSMFQGLDLDVETVKKMLLAFDIDFDRLVYQLDLFVQNISSMDQAELKQFISKIQRQQLGEQEKAKVTEKFSLWKMLTSNIWIILLLLIIMFLCSIVSCQALAIIRRTLSRKKRYRRHASRSRINEGRGRGERIRNDVPLSSTSTSSDFSSSSSISTSPGLRNSRLQSQLLLPQPPLVQPSSTLLGPPPQQLPQPPQQLPQPPQQLPQPPQQPQQLQQPNPFHQSVNNNSNSSSTSSISSTATGATVV